MSIVLKSTQSVQFDSVLNGAEKYSIAALKLLAHLVEETSDILIAADVDYKPLTWNKASEIIYGLKAEEVIGKDLSEFISIHYHNCTRQKVRETINTVGEWRGEASFIRPTDYKTVTLLMCFKQLREAHGNVLGYLVSAIDITERKETEFRLSESERWFKGIADSSPAMIWLSDENEITTYANKKWCEFTGKEIGADPEGWSSLIHPEDRLRSTEAYFQAVKLKKQITIVYRLRRADGIYRWVHDESVPRFSNDGKFIGYLGSVVDIEDEQQKHEQLLYQSTILENVSDIVVTTDLNYKVKIWNKIAEDLYGIPEQEAIGKNIGELLKFSYYGTTTEEAFAELNRKRFWKGEVSIVNRRGETKHFFHTVKFIHNDAGDEIGCLAIGRDITEKRIAEEKLKESELFYRTLITDSLDGMLLLDTKGIITFASPSVKNVLGYDNNEVVGRNGFEFIHPEDVSAAQEAFQREIQGNPKTNFITIRLLKPDGQWLWCNVRGHNLLNKAYIKSLVIYFHDETFRKEARDALQESEQRFRSLVKDLQIGVFLSDSQGNIIMCNKVLSNMMSVPEEVIIGKNIYNIMSSDMINEKNEFVPVAERPLTLTIQSKQTSKNVVLGIIHPVTKERYWIMVNSNPILDDQGNIKHVVCSVMDLTERKKLEQKLIADEIYHQRQLTQATIDGQENERRTIGEELHDNIGQQLTTIKLSLDYVKALGKDAHSEMLDIALKSVSDIINDVRSMSRSLVPFTLKDLGLIESIKELIDSLMRTRTINIEFEYARFNESIVPENQKLSIFRIVQEQLNNVIKHAGAQNVWIRLYVKKFEFVLEIKDNGKGFNSINIKKGVGILNIKNRAELFNGKVKILSQPGNGCLMLISFPLNANTSERE
jgi:PAS domain S-box-containing protein